MSPTSHGSSGVRAAGAPRSALFPASPRLRLSTPLPALIASPPPPPSPFQEGGGLYNHKSNLTIIRSTFGANTAPTGRALANHGDTWQDLKTAGDGAANSSGRPQRLKQSGHPRARCRRSTGLTGA